MPPEDKLKARAQERKRWLSTLLDRMTAPADVMRQHLGEEDQSPTLGSSAEAGVRDLLRLILPRRLAVTSGFLRAPGHSLLTSNLPGSVSPQTDVIVYDALDAIPLHSIGGAGGERMMYITVMRVEAQRQGRGINIFLNLPPGPPDPVNPWKVMDNPGPREPSVAWAEIKPGGNRVEAYLDLFFEERAYTPELLGWALDEIERRIDVRATNPAKMEIRMDGGVIIYAVFSVNQGLDDLMSKHRVFQDLRAALLRWEARYAETLLTVASGGLRAVG